MIVVLMGVAGAGKTTIGKLLAEATGWVFLEGDDFHSEANRSKMHRGIPLTDEDRAPWLAGIHKVLLGWYESGTSGIAACSALKRKYRDVLSRDIPPASIRFLCLDVPENVLKERLEQRKGHYMNPELLQSQIDTLELSPDVIRIPAEGEASRIAQGILDLVLPGRAPGSRGLS
jgi:gluconokinase